MPVFIDGYEIDLAESENHQSDAEVTDDPVESGANITDHVKLNPVIVTLVGIVSDTPIGDLAERRQLDDVHSATAYDTLAEIQNRRETVTIETSLRLYDNMILKNLGIPRTVTTGDSLQFTVTFKQITFVTNDRTIVRVAVPRAKRKVKRGAKQIEEVPPAPSTVDTAKKNRSMLSKAGDWF